MGDKAEELRAKLKALNVQRQQFAEKVQAYVDSGELAEDRRFFVKCGEYNIEIGRLITIFVNGFRTVAFSRCTRQMHWYHADFVQMYNTTKIGEILDEVFWSLDKEQGNV